MEEIELKPCPFCGGTAGAIGDGAFDEDNCFWVRCWECGAETSAYEVVGEFVCDRVETIKAATEPYGIYDVDDYFWMPLSELPKEGGAENG